MSKVETLYRWLAGDVGPAANEILAAALAHAEPPYAERIAGILLTRRHETAWAGLVGAFDRLAPGHQQRVVAQADLLRLGLAGALKSGREQARLNALTLLIECPYPQLAYLIADALRDPATQVREAAAAALRRCAEHVLASAEVNVAPAGRPTAEAVAERTGLVQGLREALRTYTLHGRRELLESCLWFAKDLGGSLWEALAVRHLRCGRLVANHLAEWNHPRLAGFLLLGLAHPEWRQTVLEMLDSWQTRDQFIAILGHSDLLADPQVRRGVQHLKRPRWLAAGGPTLSDLPPAARARVPHWVCYLGFSDRERLLLLHAWQTSPLPEVQRAAVYALAVLNTPEAVRILTDVAARECPLATFAKWFLTGLTDSQERRSPARDSDKSRSEASDVVAARSGVLE